MLDKGPYFYSSEISYYRDELQYLESSKDLNVLIKPKTLSLIGRIIESIVVIKL